VQRVHHRRVRDLDDPVCRFHDPEAERLRAALVDRAAGAIDVELDLAAEEVVGVERPRTTFASVTVGSTPPRDSRQGPDRRPRSAAPPARGRPSRPTRSSRRRRRSRRGRRRVCARGSRPARGRRCLPTRARRPGSPSSPTAGRPGSARPSRSCRPCRRRGCRAGRSCCPGRPPRSRRPPGPTRP
jgi:hypothetical protein